MGSVTVRSTRHPREDGPPFGYADLPTRLGGRLEAGDLAPVFVCAVTPYEIAQLTRPWTGKRAHPRTVDAHRVIRRGDPDAVGWRAALHEDDEDLDNAFNECHPIVCEACQL